MEPKSTGGWGLPIAAFVVAAILAMMSFRTELAINADAAAGAVPSSETPRSGDPSIAGLSVAADAEPDNVHTYY